MTDLAGKRVLITGGGRGIGAATGRALAAEGARVALVDIEGARAAQTAADMGAGHLGLAADVTNSAALNAAVVEVVEAFGGIDILIANAGVGSWLPVADTDIDMFARTIDINLTGVFRTVRAALPQIIAAKGYILIVASVGSILPMPGGSAYGASKSGVEGFANALRLEMHPHGVRVGCAHMSIVRTDLVSDLSAASESVGRLLDGAVGALLRPKTAEQCADRFVYGIRHRARRVYVPRGAFVLQWLRPLMHSAAVDMLAAGTCKRLITAFLGQVASLGSAAPDRLYAQQDPERPRLNDADTR